MAKKTGLINQSKIIGLTNQRITILVVVIASVMSMVSQGNPPEFYDNFGVGIFAFLTGLGFWMLTTKKELSDNYAFIVLMIGIVGLIVDGFIVFGG